MSDDATAMLLLRDVIATVTAERDTARAERDAAVATTVERCARFLDAWKVHPECGSFVAALADRLRKGEWRALTPPTPGVPTAYEAARIAAEADPYCSLAASEIPGFGTDRDRHRCPKLHRDKPLPTPGVPVGATCKPWCGTDWTTHAQHEPMGGHNATIDDACYCTRACRKNGRPLNPDPRTPLGGTTPGKRCTRSQSMCDSDGAHQWDKGTEWWAPWDHGMGKRCEYVFPPTPEEKP